MFQLGWLLMDQCCWVSILFGGMNVFCLTEVFDWKMTHKTARSTYSLGFVVPTARFSTKVRLKFWNSGDDVGFDLAAWTYCVNVDVEEHSACAHN